MAVQTTEILSFKGGIVLRPDFKEETAHKPIQNLPLPRKVIIPLEQHPGKPARPLYKVGSEVYEGTKIAESVGMFSAHIHASITGRITQIKKMPHPLSGEGEAVIIEGEEKEPQGRIPKRDLPPLSPREIIEHIGEKGIVGLGGAAFPTQIKLSPPENKKIDTYILNGAECEPYLTCDQCLMVEKGREILKGFKLLMQALKVEKGFIAIEENKREAIEIFRKITIQEPDLKVVIFKVKYPQGAEKQLIKSILNQEVPSGGLPYDVGVVVSNVGTAYAVYQAFYEDQPLIERVVTLAGAVNNPGNFWVRIGTTIQELIEQSGGLKKEVKKIIMGGPMMGIAQYTLEAPIIKATSGILALSEEMIISKEEFPCIHCGRCLEACPINLMPNKIGLLARNYLWEKTEEYHLFDCIECGACAYNCPSCIPLVHWVKFAKNELLKVKKTV